MSSSRCRLLKIPRQALLRLLMGQDRMRGPIPHTAKCERADFDFDSDSLVMMLQDDIYSEVPEGQTVPSLTVTVESWPPNYRSAPTWEYRWFRPQYEGEGMVLEVDYLNKLGTEGWIFCDKSDSVRAERRYLMRRRVQDSER